MTTDAVDVALIFGFMFSIFLLVAALAVRAAFKVGWEHGKSYGIKWEKLRRRRVEDRVERQMEARFQEADAGGWLRELDVQ